MDSLTRETPGPSITNNSSSFDAMGEVTYANHECQDDLDTSELESDVFPDPEDDSNTLRMFEAFSVTNSKQKGSYLFIFILFYMF